MVMVRKLAVPDVVEGEDVIAYRESISRTITLELPDREFKDLCNKAGGAGLKVSELLENFIADLIDGSRTNGSDERMYANEWFQRCWFGMGFAYSFLGYLVDNWQLENVVDIWETIQLYKADEEPDEDDIEELSEMEEELNSIYGEYKCLYKDNKETFEVEIQRVLEWCQDVENIWERKCVRKHII